MPRARKHFRDSDSDTVSADCCISLTDDYELAIVSRHASRKTSRARSQSGQRANRVSQRHANRLPEQIAGAQADAPAQQAVQQQTDASATLHAQLAPDAHEDMAVASPPECSNGYADYLASLKIDLDRNCVVVATDGLEAKCVAVAAFQECSTSFGIHVGHIVLSASAMRGSGYLP